MKDDVITCRKKVQFRGIAQPGLVTDTGKEIKLLY